MDILNFISWIKAGNYREILPTNTNNLLTIATTDPNRDDKYLPLAINAENLQSLYNKGTVTQITSSVTQVILNTQCGVITTVNLTNAAGVANMFQFYNDKITTSSVLLVSLEYKGTTGDPVVRFEIGGNGVTKIIITNTHNTVALNGLANVHFMVIK
jgi:hypothetical protein